MTVRQQQQDEVKKRLLERSDAVRADIRRELAKYDEEKYSALADRLADPGEQSVADLLVDVDLAEITRDVEEFRNIEAALLRIAHGTYGLCVDCDVSIDKERLTAIPAASRCRLCQEAFEGKDQREHHRTL